MKSILDRKLFLDELYYINENTVNLRKIDNFNEYCCVNEGFMGIDDSLQEKIAEDLVRAGLEKMGDTIKQEIQDELCTEGGAADTAEFCGVGGIVGAVLSKMASSLGDILCDVDCTNSYKISRVSKGSKEGEYKVNNVNNAEPMLIRILGGLVTLGFLDFSDTPFNKRFFKRLNKEKEKLLSGDMFSKKINPDIKDLTEHGMEYIKELNANVYLGCSFEEVFYPLVCIQCYTDKEKKIDIGSNKKLNCKVVEIEAKEITIQTLIDKVIEIIQKVFKSLLDIFCGINEVFKDFLNDLRLKEGENKENADEYEKLSSATIEEFTKKGMDLVKDMIK